VNNINLVKEALDDLRKNHIEVILGGGWAEELLEIIPPKVHSDIDLFYISNSFSLLEEYISRDGEVEKAFTNAPISIMMGLQLR
jgi:hypothetical protein